MVRCVRTVCVSVCCVSVYTHVNIVVIFTPNSPSPSLPLLPLRFPVLTLLSHSYPSPFLSSPSPHPLPSPFLPLLPLPFLFSPSSTTSSPLPLLCTSPLLALTLYPTLSLSQMPLNEHIRWASVLRREQWRQRLLDAGVQLLQQLAGVYCIRAMQQGGNTYIWFMYIKILPTGPPVLLPPAGSPPE